MTTQRPRLTPATDTGAGASRPSPAPFLGLAAALSVARLAGLAPDWSGIVHQVALPPLDLFADVRLLTARATSYPAFLAGLAASITLRSGLVALVFGGLSVRRWALAMRFYLVALPVALLSGTLAFTGLALSYSPFVWLAIAVTVLATLSSASWLWTGAELPRRWIGRHRQRAPLRLVAAYLVALAALGSVADGTPATLAATWASALLTAAAVHRIAGVARRSGHLPWRAAVVVPLLTIPLLTVPLLAPSGGTGPPARPVPADTVLFVVPGVSTESGRGTMFSLDPATLGVSCERTFYFSYAGPGDGAPRGESVCPIRTGAPYDETHSQAPLTHVRDAFEQQVRRLTGPAVVIAHSQGAWIASDALARNPDLDVEAVVMLGPFPHHDVGYEPPDGDPSPRRDAVRLVLGAIDSVDRTAFRAGAPLARELLAAPGAVDRIMSRPLPGVRSLTITSWFDLVAMPRGWKVPGARNACPLFVPHGSLPTSDVAAGTIVEFLDDGERSGCSPWRTALGPVAAAFTVPPDPGHG